MEVTDLLWTPRCYNASMSSFPIQVARTLIAFAKPSQSLLEPSILQLRVGLADLDENLHMNNARYFDHMNRARMELAARTGMLAYMFRNKMSFLAGAVSLRFRKDLAYRQRYELHTQTAYWDEDWVVFEQRFMVDGRARAVGLARGQIRNAQGRVRPVDFLGMMGEQVPERPRLQPHVEAWFAWLSAEKGRLP